MIWGYHYFRKHPYVPGITMYNWYIFRTETHDCFSGFVVFFPHEKLDHLPIQPPEKTAPVIRDTIPTIGPSTCCEGGTSFRNTKPQNAPTRTGICTTCTFYNTIEREMWVNISWSIWVEMVYYDELVWSLVVWNSVYPYSLESQYGRGQNRWHPKR